MARSAAQILGQSGERLALDHYERLGYRCLEQNFRTRAGEIDLIVCDDDAIVFVEVKTRRRGGLDPLLGITPAKIRRLRSLALAWLAVRADRPRRSELRFDAVAVVVDERDRLVSLDQYSAIC